MARGLLVTLPENESCHGGRDQAGVKKEADDESLGSGLLGKITGRIALRVLPTPGWEDRLVDGLFFRGRVGNPLSRVWCFRKTSREGY